MDLIVPKTIEGHEKMPVIVWVCGGAFRVVDRSVWIPELLHFAMAGYVVASLDYGNSYCSRFLFLVFIRHKYIANQTLMCLVGRYSGKKPRE
ncbi:MAG: hypothetical protein IJ123_04535 [Blautia sp.]|nr:hypothetical protein [Blautia sp.]